jgi:hypothetical protein
MFFLPWFFTHKLVSFFLSQLKLTLHIRRSIPVAKEEEVEDVPKEPQVLSTLELPVPGISAILQDHYFVLELGV